MNNHEKPEDVNKSDIQSVEPHSCEAMGAQTLAAPGEKTPGNRKLSRKSILILAAGSLAVLLAVLVLFNLFRPLNRFMGKFDEKNFAQAFEIFDEHLDSQDADFQSRFTEYMTEKLEAFQKGTLPYEELSPYLDAVREHPSLTYTALTNLMETAEKLRLSREAYESLLLALEQKNYLAAAQLYDDILEKDAVYRDAQRLYQEHSEAIQQALILKSKEIQEKEGVLAAYEYINAYEEKLGGDLLKERISSLKAARRQELIEEGNAFAAQHRYAKAIELLQKNMAYEGEEELVKKISEYQSQKETYEAERLQELKRSVSVSYDEVNRNYIAVPRGYDGGGVNLNRRVNIEPYLIFRVNSLTLCWRVGFQRDEWLFTDEIVFSGAGENTVWTLDIRTRQTKVDFGTVYEWGEFRHDTADSEISTTQDFSLPMEKLYAGGDVDLLFQGTEQRKHALTQRERNNLTDFWELYNILNDHPHWLAEWAEAQ